MTTAHFLFNLKDFAINVTNLHQSIDETCRALGYELVELECSAGGMLRVTIDWPWLPGGSEQPITVDDCERVTRQLQYALEVAQADYKRLEVSSPGIDRPLNTALDFERFSGSLVDLQLKQPVGAAVAGGLVAANRKKFRGLLSSVDAPAGRWQIVFNEQMPVHEAQSDAKSTHPGKKKKTVSCQKSQSKAPDQALVFTLDELAFARLAPVIDFNSRGSKADKRAGVK